MTRTVLTVGQFDGVHRGHGAILRQARRLADELGGAEGPGGRVTAITFAQHPSAVLRAGSEPPRLLSTQEKTARLREAGADEVVVLGPTPQDLAQTAEAFIARLVEQYHPVAVVEGEDFRFGKGRTGDVGVLRELGDRFGFTTHVMPKERATLGDHTQVPVSSSLARWLVGRGRVCDAAACLGRAFALTAKVVRGDQRGRTIGVPTANLDAADLEGFILPADGVYAGFATLPASGATGREAIPAAISVGDKPTFRGRELTVEVHLLDYRPEPFDALYGRTLTLTFERWLRDQYAYPDLESLIRQLGRDVDEARQVLAAPPANISA